MHWRPQSTIEIIFHYPFSIDFNRYADLQRSALSATCPRIEPVTRTALLARGTPRRAAAAVLNWYEDKLGWDREHQSKVLVKAILLLALIRLRCAKVVWVRHNFWPHGMPRRSIRQRILLFFMRLLTTSTVTHRVVADDRSTVVPHPLYFDGDLPDTTRDIDYLYFGLISRYKGLDRLLASWPARHRLVIAGEIRDAALSDALKQCVAERQLDVEFIDRFLPSVELEALLLRTRFVVLPHLEGTAIVSGSFYHAISFGANIVARDGAFGRAVKEAFSFVSLFEDDALESVLDGARYVPATAVLAEARASHGATRCQEAWRQLLMGSSVAAPEPVTEPAPNLAESA